MGWTFYNEWNSPTTYESEKAEVERIYSNGGKNEILQCTKVGSVWYLAVKAPTGLVWGGVCLTKRSKGWGHKDLDESSGPYHCQAPVSLINKLSPTTDEWAMKWRQGCLDNAANKKAKNTKAVIGKAKLVNGAIVDVSGMFGKYNGVDLVTMTVEDIDRRQFWSPDVRMTFTLKAKSIKTLAERMA